jgi:hypothetical protein
MLKQADESVPPRASAGGLAGKDDVRRKSDDFPRRKSRRGCCRRRAGMVGMNVAVVPPSQILQTPAGARCGTTALPSTREVSDRAATAELCQGTKSLL